MSDEKASLSLEIECGKTVTTKINGVQVQVTCTTDATEWKPPPPPGGTGTGYNAFHVVSDDDVIDLDDAVDRFVREDLP